MESLKNNQNKFNNEYETTKTILEHLSKISNLENLEKTKQIRNDIKYIKFKEWLIKNKAIFDDNFEYPTCFGIFNNVGIKSKRSINCNEALFFIPKSLIIDSNQLRNTQEFKELFENDDLKEFEKLNVLIISVFLLKEYIKIMNNEFSFWKPYLDLIECESPIFWENDLLQQLDEPNMIEAILEHRSDLLNYYNKIIKHDVINSNEIPFTIFATFYSFVLSRNFYVNDNQLLLVPFADALNHNHVSVKYEIFDSLNYICKHTLYFDDSIKAKNLKRTNNYFFYEHIKDTEVVPCSDPAKLNENNDKDYLDLLPYDYFIISTNNQVFKQGEQVFNFYGEHSNEYLLKWYGFCYLNNIYDCVTISLNLPKYEDADFDKYLQLLFEKYLSEGIINDEVFNTLLFNVNSRKINLNLIKYVRFFLYYEDDSVEEFLNYQFNINVEIEVIKRCIELFKISFENKSKNYKLDDDIQRLKNIYEECNSLNEIDLIKNIRLSNVFIFRISQKMNILRQIEMCEMILKIYSNALDYVYSILGNDSPDLANEEVLRALSNIHKIYNFAKDITLQDNKTKLNKYFKSLKLFSSNNEL
jgi:hypothetical protein